MDDKFGKLRAEAEARLNSIPELSENPSLEEVKSMLHELQVYQIELEMQNEELRHTQQQLEESRDQYTDLFEFAPVGYLILDKNGIIRNCNLTCCKLLGIERSHLINKPFMFFMASKGEEFSHFQICLKEVFESQQPLSHELSLKRKNSLDFTARLDVIFMKDEASESVQCRMTITDISNEKKTERLLALTKQLQEEKEKLRISEAKTTDAILEAQEKERSRIATDLHDSINPLLSIARLNADALRSQVEKDELGKEKLDNIISLLESALKGIKEISANLSPSILNNFGLSKALEHLCNRLKQTGKIKVEYCTHRVKEKIDPRIELNLYRITQELLNNIIKHAEATETEVQLIQYADSIVLMVGDNGVGFIPYPEILETNGVGFKNISSRIKLLNGRLDIDSTDGKGTTITIELPL